MSGRSLSRRRNTDTGSSGASSSKNTNNGLTRFEEPEQRLIPGIPDEITLDLISPKLSWNVFHIFSSVSRRWRQAIQNREVYNARVRSQSTEKLVVINHFITRACTHAMGLYSVSDESFYQLPPIPNGGQSIHQYFKCISIDGKLYALGGGGVSDHSRDDVYVLDLAAQRQWKQCKGMGSARRHFGPGVLGGKIYVFGGIRSCGELSQVQCVRRSEMYDPQSETWDPIEAIPRRWGRFTEVTPIGEELFLHSGPWQDFELDSVREISLQVYHPNKGEWRTLKPVKRDLGREPGTDIENQFISQGQLYLMTKTGIHAYDKENKSWIPRHSFSSAEITHALDSGCLKFWTTIALGDELVTILGLYTDVYSEGGYEIVSPEGRYLLHSIGFGGQQETIMWQKVDCSFRIKYNPSICSIQL